ncbi:hypothetical protein [Candidatus Viadribacter manganicus]|uniref:Uncharacterized protein n=1 Tax=Candidatus Viadribacter manganicus TaxID=1759059 RepID=A0A1B1AEX6_9PROT|nr:hypothetical protein [Candidatus Viadribacter manganicus]ANP45123.1 hypothetical protein ATE48_03915 [Candidatus Viadribacter manganicus]
MALSFLPALALALCFGPPQPVQIAGYSGHAMEPFISRDGETLFFNNRNGPSDQTDMFWASRIDDTHFRYRGPVAGANSAELDGVPSLARDGTFAYISPRIANGRAAAIWTGHWAGAAVDSPVLNHALTPGRWPLFNMDAEISADGRRLYIADTRWAAPIPRASDLRLAVRTRDGWRRAREFDFWFASINTSRALEYAPATSSNELELYFTRLTPHFLAPPALEIMVATRADVTSAFGVPARIAAIIGFVEGPSVAPDGALYLHAKIDEMHVLMHAARTC